MNRRERFLTLLWLYDLRLGDVARSGAAARFAGHPALAAVAWRLENDWLAELAVVDDPVLGTADVVAGLRTLAARDRLPSVYRWLARTATWPEVVRFLSLEGGPDGGFDDLVAMCQIGLSGAAKVELARNYWDELGNGSSDRVHTVLHEQLVAAVGMTPAPLPALPVEALERAALGGLLATNHWLQPEMLGALGLTELQAGPRCRLVLQAFDRLGAPEDAYPFYAEHAEVDPRHGKDWLENAIGPAVEAHPEWRARVLRGALWRSRTNAAFFTRVYDVVTDPASTAA